MTEWVMFHMLGLEAERSILPLFPFATWFGYPFFATFTDDWVTMARSDLLLISWSSGRRWQNDWVGYVPSSRIRVIVIESRRKYFLENILVHDKKFGRITKWCPSSLCCNPERWIVPLFPSATRFGYPFFAAFTNDRVTMAQFDLIFISWTSNRRWHNDWVGYVPSSRLRVSEFESRRKLFWKMF